MLFSERIFEDEKIIPPQRTDAIPVPEEILAVRRMDREGTSIGRSQNALFVQEAQLLEQFEDDYPYERDVDRFIHTYRYFTDSDLRGYFTWRKYLRRGEVKKTIRSNAFLYINELINLISCTDPLDGYRKLVNFREQYGKLDDKIIKQLNEWIRDFVIYYNLDKNLLPKLPDDKIDHSLWVLMHLDEFSAHEITEAIRVFSTYNIEKSKLYQKKKQDAEYIIASVLKQIEEDYKKYGDNSWMEDFLGYMVTCQVNLFYRATFYDRAIQHSFDYRINSLRIYHNVYGNWTLDFFDTNRLQKRFVGTLLRMIDALTRKIYKLSPQITFKDPTDWMTQLVTDTIRSVQKQEKTTSEKNTTFTINHAALDTIRKNANYTRDRLMTEEEQACPTPRRRAGSRRGRATHSYRRALCTVSA